MTTIRTDVLTALATLFGALARADGLEIAAAVGFPPPAPPPPATPGAMPTTAPEPASASQPEPANGASPEPARGPRTLARSTSAEAVYRAVIGADEPLSLRQIADATRLSKPSLYRAIRRLLEEARLYRGGPESSQHARYAVTQTAADAAYRRLRA